MAMRAAERQMAADAEEFLRDQANDPHVGHHTHLRGTAVYCSCGEDRGVTCVVIEDGLDLDSLSCGICGQRGVCGF